LARRARYLRRCRSGLTVAGADDLGVALHDHDGSPQWGRGDGMETTGRRREHGRCRMDDAVHPSARPEHPRPILQRIPPERRATLERLYQLYRYDLSEYNKQEIKDDGTFPHFDLGPYVDDPNRRVGPREHAVTRLRGTDGQEPR
jgi:hypothetical protein